MWLTHTKKKISKKILASLNFHIHNHLPGLSRPWVWLDDYCLNTNLKRIPFFQTFPQASTKKKESGGGLWVLWVRPQTLSAIWDSVDSTEHAAVGCCTGFSTEEHSTSSLLGTERRPLTQRWTQKGSFIKGGWPRGGKGRQVKVKQNAIQSFSPKRAF